MNKYIFTLLVLLNSTFVIANNNHAQVFKYKGQVTVTDTLNKSVSYPIKQNQIIKNNSIIKTFDKSFVILKYKNSTTVTLAPNGHLKVAIINANKDVSYDLLSLIKGSVRTEVNPKKKKTPNFFIKTGSASMGVRGTDFLVLYNQSNKTTNLLTFKGSVGIIKNPSFVKSSMNQSEIKKLSKLISSSPISIKAGRLSSFSPNRKEPSKPIKISPIQFIILNKNKTFIKNIDIKNLNVKKELHKLKYESNLDGDAPIIGNKTSPRSGGLIDLKTGYYIQPDKNSKLDKELGVYTFSQNLGNLNQDGSYSPPKGFNIDPNKGFILIKKNNKNSKYKRKLKKLRRNNWKPNKSHSRKINRLKSRSKRLKRLKRNKSN
jgi:hypothetical protein